MERGEIEAIARARCGERENIIAVYLYGSHARGTAGTRSDVDIGVLYRTVPGPGLAALSLGLEADLESDFGAPVQLLTLNTAPADLVHRVLRDGVLIVERDASARVAFEVRARNEYFDLEPYVRQPRLLARIDEIARDVVEHRLDDLLAFASEIRRRLAGT